MCQNFISFQLHHQVVVEYIMATVGHENLETDVGSLEYPLAKKKQPAYRAGLPDEKCNKWRVDNL